MHKCFDPSLSIIPMTNNVKQQQQQPNTGKYPTHVNPDVRLKEYDDESHIFISVFLTQRYISKPKTSKSHLDTSWHHQRYTKDTLHKCLLLDPEIHKWECGKRIWISVSSGTNANWCALLWCKERKIKIKAQKEEAGEKVINIPLHLIPEAGLFDSVGEQKETIPTASTISNVHILKYDALSAVEASGIRLSVSHFI